jgi:hypothetical protein
MKYLVIVLLMIGCIHKDEGEVVKVRINDHLELEEVCINDYVYYYNSGSVHYGPILTPKYSEGSIVEECR